jgi:hypothetical protein
MNIPVTRWIIMIFCFYLCINPWFIQTPNANQALSKLFFSIFNNQLSILPTQSHSFFFKYLCSESKHSLRELTNSRTYKHFVRKGPTFKHFLRLYEPKLISISPRYSADTFILHMLYSVWITFFKYPNINFK